MVLNIDQVRKANSKTFGGSYSAKGSEVCKVETDQKPNINFVNKLSKVDFKISELENKIESVIYSDKMTFSKLAKIGFYTLMIHSLIESIEPKNKDNKKLLNSLRLVKDRFK